MAKEPRDAPQNAAPNVAEIAAVKVESTSANNAAGNTERGEEGRMLFHGFMHLMLSQLLSRVLTFLLNWMIVKKLSPEEYGLAGQYQLLTGTILFLGREGFRRGCVRSEDRSSSSPYISSVQTLNLAWLSVPAGAILALGFCSTVVWWRQLAMSDPQFKAISILGLATILELLSEPLYILCQSLSLLQVRVILEASATFLRCVLTYGLLVYGIGSKGGLLFAYAELGFSSTLMVGYWTYFLFFADRKMMLKDEKTKKSLPLLPSSVPGEARWDNKSVRICMVFARQAVAKHLLGKCDEFVLSVTDSRYNQGVYNLVTNLGSLVVRSVLQPFEESAFLMFAKTSKTPKKTQKLEGSEKEREESEVRVGAGSELDRKERLSSTLSLSMKLVSLVGLLFVSFGPPYSYALLALLYGSRWSGGETPVTLSYYCGLIMALAVNGITESFLHSVGSERDLSLSNRFLILSSLLHVALNAKLCQLAGATGLVMANIANMAVRVGYSLSFIARYFQDLPSFSLRHSVPSGPVLSFFVISSLVTHFSEKTLLRKKKNGVLSFSDASAHIFVGVLCLGGIATSLFLFEKKFLRSINSLLRRKRQEREKKD